MRVLAAILTLATALLAPAYALAYVGPGAGLSLLGALWGLLAALGVALMFILAWPVRRLLRNRHRSMPRGEPESRPTADGLSNVHPQSQHRVSD